VPFSDHSRAPRSAQQSWPSATVSHYPFLSCRDGYTKPSPIWPYWSNGATTSPLTSPVPAYKLLPREQDVPNRLYNKVSSEGSRTCNITKSDFYRTIFTSPICIGNITTQRALNFPHKRKTQKDLSDRIRYHTGNIKYLTKRSLILL